MRIIDMNTAYAAVRSQLMEKDGADKNNLNTRTLEVAQIPETDYLSHIAADDVAMILIDIRESTRQTPPRRTNIPMQQSCRSSSKIL